MWLTVVLEHPSLRYALERAGICVFPEQGPGQLVGTTVPLLVAWSSREQLLLKPEYAWLSLPQVRFLRLPVPRQAIQDALDETRGSMLSDTLAEHCICLSLPLGQWQWALKQMELELEGQRCPKNTGRLQKLRDFCLLRWPEWYDECLKWLQACIYQGNATTAGRLLRLMAEEGGRVAVYDAYRILFHGAAGDIVNRGAGAFRAAIRLYLAGGLAGKELSDIAVQADWWPRQTGDLLQVGQALEDIRRCGIDPDDVLRGRHKQIVERVAIITEVIEELTALSSEPAKIRELWPELERTERALGSLMEMVQSLAGEKEVFRQEFLERIWQVGQHETQ